VANWLGVTEAAVKQFNKRVKGTEQFWGDGIEPILALARHLDRPGPTMGAVLGKPACLCQMNAA